VGQWDKEGLEWDTERDREKPTSIKTIAKQRLDRLKKWDSQWDADGTEPEPSGTGSGTEPQPIEDQKFLEYIERKAEDLRAAAALEEWSEYFEERAGIMQYDGEMSRTEAELRTLLEIIYGYLGLHHPIILEQLQPLIAYAHGCFDKE
jgi:hypothetical protein